MYSGFSQTTSLGLLSLLITVVAGCFDSKPQRYPVRGVVKFVDGTPLSFGSIEFEAVDVEVPVTATSPIGEDGRFELGTYDVADGAIAGRHRVAVISTFQIGNGVERPGLIPPELMDRKFSNARTSGIEFTVEPQQNEFEVIVDYAPMDQEASAAVN